MQMKGFSFGVRCKLETFFLFGVRIGVEDATSLDLLHEFSLSVQTCLSFSCVQADAFCTWRKRSGKSWQRAKQVQK